MSLRILNAEPEGFSQEARAILASLGDLVEEPLTQSDLVGRVGDAHVLIVRLGLRVTRQVLEAGRSLQVIMSATTGLDHIDLDAALQRGITVLSLQGEAEFLRTVHSTAEHTVALLLSLVRRIPWAFDAVRRGQWARDQHRGQELHGRRLGIVGIGRVGQQVAHYASAFGMSVGAYDPYRRSWPEDVVRFDRLEALLSWSEVLSVHVSLTDETRGMLGRDRLALLPRGAVVVNTSRGGVLDEDALVGLLEQGHLGGAAVDVLVDEQSAQGRAVSPMIRYAQGHDNLLITPHLGGATWDAMRRTEVFMAEKLRAFLQERAPA